MNEFVPQVFQTSMNIIKHGKLNIERMYVLVPEVDIHGLDSLSILCVFYMVLDSDFYYVLYVFCILFFQDGTVGYKCAAT